MELPITRKLGTKGRLVLPKAALDRLGAKPGDRIRFEVTDGKVVLRRG